MKLKHLATCLLLLAVITLSAAAADLTSVTDTLSDYTAGASSNHTINFTTATDSNLTEIIIGFPAGFDVSAASNGTFSGLTGNNFACGAAGQNVSCTFDSENVTAGSNISVEILNVKNANVTGNYTVSVKTLNSSVSVDGPTNSSAFEIMPAGLGDFIIDVNESQFIFVPFNFLLVALDEFGNVKTDYSGNVTFNSNDPDATLPSDNGTAWANGAATFELTFNNVGIFTFNVTDGSVTKESPDINVSSQAPNITSSPVLTGAVGALYVYDVEAEDPENETLTFSLTQHPNNMTINESTGLIEWVPESEGMFNVTVEVRDEYNNTDNQSYQVNVSSEVISYNVLTPTFGGPNQKRTNPKARYLEDRAPVRVTAVVQLKNNGAFDITNITATDTVNDARFNMTYELPSVIPAGQTVNVNLTATVPADLDAIKSNFEVNIENIGLIKFMGTANGTAVESQEIPLTMQAENNLAFKDMDVCVNNDCENVDDGDNVDKIKPGDDMEVKVELENTFNRNDRVSINDVEVEVEINDRDFDVSENERLGDIREDDTDQESITFDVDRNTDEDTYSMEVRAFGEDENGARHGEVWHIDLDVEREIHSIDVRSLTLSPDKILCNQRSVELRVNVENTGKRDEEEVAIEVVGDSLNYREKITNLKLDKDDKTTRVFTIPLPKDLKSGKHAIGVTTFYDFNQPSDAEVVYVVAPECNAGEEEGESTYTPPDFSDQIGIVVEESNTSSGLGQFDFEGTLGAEEEKSFTESNAYVALLVIAIIVVLAAAIGITVRLLR
ncbi:hypothetical protein D6745_04655 [Candidatus Woesearchaeota archaeon]|nr:MAG: hypothetical protein D6745_04655 [Candidatus Woesearchaeota archaeon]